MIDTVPVVSPLESHSSTRSESPCSWVRCGRLSHESAARAYGDQHRSASQRADVRPHTHNGDVPFPNFTTHVDPQIKTSGSRLGCVVFHAARDKRAVVGNSHMLHVAASFVDQAPKERPLTGCSRSRWAEQLHARESYRPHRRNVARNHSRINRHDNRPSCGDLVGRVAARFLPRCERNRCPFVREVDNVTFHLLLLDPVCTSSPRIPDGSCRSLPRRSSPQCVVATFLFCLDGHTTPPKAASQPRRNIII